MSHRLDDDDDHEEGPIVMTTSDSTPMTSAHKPISFQDEGDEDDDEDTVNYAHNPSTWETGARQAQESKVTSSVLWGYFWWLSLGLGWVCGFHWAYLALLAFRQRQKRRVWSALAHMFSYWVVSILFFVFRGQLERTFTPCPDGQLDKHCLWDIQETDYKFFFVSQIILILYCLFRWLADACWIWTLIQGFRLRERQLNINL